MDSDDEEVCTCGHHFDDHVDGGECTDEECGCGWFQPNEEAYLA